MEFTHFNKYGKGHMIDVANKSETERIATASCKIRVNREIITKINSADMKKGDVLAVAKIAGIQAAKRTSDLIPLCHPLLLNNIEVDCEVLADRVEVTSKVECTGKTGVEMEALTAVSVALLTVYDMCKAVDKKMRIGDIELCQKLKTPV